MSDTGSEFDTRDELCRRITAAMKRNGLENVRCSFDAKGPRLVGHVGTAEDRSFAFAIARTTAGTVQLSNGIEVHRSE